MYYLYNDQENELWNTANNLFQHPKNMEKRK